MIGPDRRDPRFRLGVLLLAVLGAALVGGLLAAGIDLDLHLPQRLLPPAPGHPLGTDALGRDILSCLACGTLVSLAVALVVVALATGGGLVLGYLAGWHGGWLGSAIMRAADLALAFPGLLLALLLAALWGQGILHLVLALAAGGWAGTARLVRGEVLRIKEQDFILAALGFNASPRHIARQHVLPLLFPVLLTQAVSGIAAVILAEASLNFLGLGLDPRLPTLGGMIDSGRGHLLERPGLVLVPGACLVMLVAGFLLLAEGFGSRPGTIAFEKNNK
ncbi:MAG: ABC transporter permease [Acidobacteria bacterium]|jgi:peptide/nickel transport system permease protein|nr:ABC transporter permease [Acidobacteriota bacterium]